jgi:hypothetical protein
MDSVRRLLGFISGWVGYGKTPTGIGLCRRLCILFSCRLAS